MNIYFYTNSTGQWNLINYILDSENGVYYVVGTSFGNYLTKYWWSVNCTDGIGWMNETYHFTTGENQPPSISEVTPSNGLTGVSISISTLSVNINDPDGDNFNWTIKTSPNIGNSFENNALKSIGRKLLTHKDDSKLQISDIIDLFEEKEQKNIVASLAIGEDVWDYEACIGIITRFESIRRKSENKLLEKIKAAEKNNDLELLANLLNQKQKMALLNEKKKMVLQTYHLITLFSSYYNCYCHDRNHYGDYAYNENYHI